MDARDARIDEMFKADGAVDSYYLHHSTDVFE